MTTLTEKTILVTGATGRQGKAFISGILSEEKLAAQHPNRVTIVEGDLDSADTIRKVFEDAKKEGRTIWGVFCVLAFPGLGADADGEEKQGKMVADLSLEYGVSHFVFSSVERGGEGFDATMMGDRLAKINIEKHVKHLGAQGLNWTILRPGFFMENYEGFIGRITFGVLKAGLKPSTTVQIIGVKDIGLVAAGVFRDPIAFHSQILVVVAEASTMSQQEAAYKSARGRDIPSIPAVFARGLIAMNSHTKQLIMEMERVHRVHSSPEGAEEYHLQWEAAKRAHPNMMSFEKWAQQDNVEARGNDWNGISLGKLLRGRQ
ncbi:hypothetical protein VNI00_003358 [Paramarasmius palmivorus]|uniref:NmrA-like domain-containing protein n=1 Tax=Paramarasmius palmivorus TaxID=297713 RepID=A0AAW0DU57_9AGAR